MGCTQSRIDNEESVSRCKDQRNLMREAVVARKAFAAGHSGYVMALNNIGAVLSDYGHGESQPTQEQLLLHQYQQSIDPTTTKPPPPPPPLETLPPPLPTASLPALRSREPPDFMFLAISNANFYGYASGEARGMASKYNDHPRPGYGIEVMYRFAGFDPFERSTYFGPFFDLGQFERFRRIFHHSTYMVLLAHKEREREILSSLFVEEEASPRKKRLTDISIYSGSEGRWFMGWLLVDRVYIMTEILLLAV